jgi:hypothetical protein
MLQWVGKRPLERVTAGRSQAEGTGTTGFIEV